MFGLLNLFNCFGSDASVSKSKGINIRDGAGTGKKSAKSVNGMKSFLPFPFSLSTPEPEPKKVESVFKFW